MTVRWCTVLCWIALAAAPAAAGADSISASQWQMGIRVEMSGTEDTLAALGVAPDATSDYDPAYDVPHPPSPPGDYIELFFPHTGGGWPELLSTRYASDISSPASPAWVLNVRSSFGSGAATLRWDAATIAQLPQGYVLAMTDSGSGNTVLLRQQDSYAFAYTGPRSFRIWATYDATLVGIRGQWNLLSVPRNALDMSVAGLFPGASPPAFGYDDAYQIAETLDVGAGYWLKFGAPSVIAVAGTAVPSAAVSLKAGWNLVGSVDHAIACPAGWPLASGWFSYEGTYVLADSIRPGKGYWIKSSADAPLVLGGGAATAPKRGDVTDLPSIVISDSHGARQRLYVSFAGIDLRPYELPPLPPEGGFDARFSTGTFAAAARRSGDAFVLPWLEIHGGAYPLAVRFDGFPGRLPLAVGDGSRTWKATRGPVVIRETVSRLAVTVGAAAPAEFTLAQNYPNPFNPVTRISYTLPERAEVRIVICDLLGRVVSRAGAELRDAGPNDATVDGGRLGLSTGAYLYRLEAEGKETGRRFSAARRFLYIK